MSRHNRGRPLDGFLVVDKPVGMSSNQVVQKAKRMLMARKVGHTGSLDPLATGVLPLCFGEATKFSQYLLDSDKKYWARLKLGVETATGDADGEIIAEHPVDGIARSDVERVMSRYQGEIEQVPSMYSAIKHQGQPLYKFARAGVEVERKPRLVTLYSNELVAFTGETIEIEVHCSKGTYVRSLAEDIGRDLGCGAHVVALRRRAAGPFGEQDLVTFDMLEAACDKGRAENFLKPIASAVCHWPEVTLTDSMAFYVRQGQPVQVPKAPVRGWVRLAVTKASSPAAFIGVGEILDDGRVAPRRLVSGG
ncbi:MAG: tRNA pseudouridine(55) synthase TruB [Pseudomonadales bacterium]